MEEQPSWKRAYPFNLTDKEWADEVRKQMEMYGYSKDSQRQVLRRHRDAIEHNKSDKGMLS